MAAVTTPLFPPLPSSSFADNPSSSSPYSFPFAFFSYPNITFKAFLPWASKRSLPARCSASKGGDSGDSYGPLFANGNSEIESPVPFEQQPINEYQSLLESVYFCWAVEDVWSYGLKLGAVGASFTLLVGWPVAAASVNPEQEFWKCGIGAVCGGIMCTTLSALRLYLGWAYVGNRLFSATVEYEETGWYDGQVWVKPPEVLARDRLLGSYAVKPALNRVKLTLVALAVSLMICVLVVTILPSGKVSLQTELQAAMPLEKINTNTINASSRHIDPDAIEQEMSDAK